MPQPGVLVWWRRSAARAKVRKRLCVAEAKEGSQEGIQERFEACQEQDGQGF